MIQATLFLEELNTKKCIKGFFPRYTKEYASFEEWNAFVQSQKDIEKFLFSVLEKNRKNIAKELNDYIQNIEIEGIVVKEFHAKEQMLAIVDVNFKKFLNCPFVKQYVSPKVLAPLKLIPNIEKCIGIGNKFQKPFYPEIVKVLKEFGVYGSIDHYHLEVYKEK